MVRQTDRGVGARDGYFRSGVSGVGRSPGERCAGRRQVWLEARVWGWRHRGGQRRTQTDYKGLECHGAKSGLNSVGDGEPWKGFNQASDMIPPA